jgi:DNA polymerase III delta subunit
VPAESALQFLRSSESDRTLPPAVVIGGPHAFLREYVLRVAARIFTSAGCQYRPIQLGASDDLSALLDELSAPDLFAPRKLVACRVLRSRRDPAASDDGGSRRARSRRRDDDALAEAVEGIRAPLALALLFERDTVPAAVRRITEQRGLLVTCQRPFDSQLQPYVRALARCEGFDLTPSAAELLAWRYGYDLGGAVNSIAKAALRAESDRRLDTPDFEEPSAARAPALFELAESISLGQGAAALAHFQRAIAVGRDPMELFGVEIVPVLRRMLTAAALLRERKSPSEIAGALGLAPQSPLASRAIEGARRLGLARLESALARAATLDRGIKQGLVRNREQAVAGLLLDLVAPAAG